MVLLFLGHLVDSVLKIQLMHILLKYTFSTVSTFLIKIEIEW